MSVASQETSATTVVVVRWFETVLASSAMLVGLQQVALEATIIRRLQNFSSRANLPICRKPLSLLV